MFFGYNLCLIYYVAICWQFGILIKQYNAEKLYSKAKSDNVKYTAVINK